MCLQSPKPCSGNAQSFTSQLLTCIKGSYLTIAANLLRCVDGQRLLHRVRSGLMATPVQMRVRADRRVDLLVAQVRLDDGQRNTSLDEPRCAGVSQVVQPYVLVEFRLSECGPPHGGSEGFDADSSARSVGEQPLVAVVEFVEDRFR